MKPKKIKIVIPEGDVNFPTEWQGKEMELTVSAVEGPEGLHWALAETYWENLTEVKESGLSPGPVASVPNSPRPTIIEAIGAPNIESIHIDFYKPEAK